MKLIFGTVFPVIKHLIKSLNVYGAQNMHIRIKHIRHNQNYNYISPVPEPTSVALPRSSALKLSIHLLKKKPQNCTVPIQISGKLENALATDIAAAELLGYRLSLLEVN